VIFHHGRPVTTHSGRSAQRFRDKVGQTGEQQLMARATGNYKRGNEHDAKQHSHNAR
jgi:hypothetical protein